MVEIIENGRIESTSLGSHDSPCFSAWLHLTFGGTAQGFGGYSLDTYDKELKRRTGTVWGMEFILRTMHAVGVERWEDLKGKYCRVRRDGTGCGASIVAIGHIVEDKWFEPKVDLAAFIPQEPAREA